MEKQTVPIPLWCAAVERLKNPTKVNCRKQWRKEHFIDTIGRNKKALKAYIQNQLQKEQIAGQVSIKEFVDLVTGGKNTKA